MTPQSREFLVGLCKMTIYGQDFVFPFLVQLALNWRSLMHCLMCIPLWQLGSSQKQAKIINF